MSNSNPANGSLLVLVIHVGGTHVKVVATGQRDHRRFDSGLRMTPKRMVAGVPKAVDGWKFDVVAIGYPGPVVHNRPISEPHNLACGWVGFNFEAAFCHPVRMINDAAMQALGSYKGGRMLFLGLGTGLGSAMIVNDELVPMELGHLPYQKGELSKTMWASEGSSAWVKRGGESMWQS